ncbi:MAG: hypothetical protein ABIJ75_11730 [Actinomycetota bacterium]
MTRIERPARSASWIAWRPSPVPLDPETEVRRRQVREALTEAMVVERLGEVGAEGRALSPESAIHLVIDD